MSKMKKIAGLLLAVVMVVAMSATALAEETYTITIAYDQTGHTYEAYQIFSGTLVYGYTEYTENAAPPTGTQLYTYNSTTGEYETATWDVNFTGTYYVLDGTSTTSTVLSDIKWGTGIDNGTTDNSEALLDALKADNTVIGKDDNNTDITFGSLFTTCTTAADVAEVLEKYNTNATVAETFAQIASEHLTGTTSGTLSGGTETDTDTEGNILYKISGLSAGYYLIKDQDGSVSGEDAYTDIILEVVANVKVSAKADTPTLDKTITGTTTDQSGTGHKDDTTADYDIGDDVPFTLAATLPSNYDDYDTYKLFFHDTLSTGLTFNSNSVVVTVYTAVTGLTTWGTGPYYTYADGTFTVVDTTAGDPDSSVTYYTATVVNSTNGGYVVVSYDYTAVSSLTAFESNTTYYTLDSSTGVDIYTEVDTKTVTTPVSGTTYYVRDCYHYEWAGDIIEFANGTKYYTYDATTGTYTAVDTTSVPSPVSGTTYYINKTQANCSFEVHIADTNKLYSDDAGQNLITVDENSIIVVSYTAKLNSGAANIETNAAYIEFSNNPNNNGAGTGTTPPDLTTIFTFTMDVNKVDESGYPLEGAGFTLYKKADITAFETGVIYYTYTNGKMTEVVSGANFDSSETYYVVVGGGEKTATEQYQNVGKITAFESGVTYYTYDATAANPYIEVDTTQVITPDQNTDYYVKGMNDFTFDGLAVGSYILVETTVPAGYNALEDYVFSVIISKTEEDENGNASVSELTIQDEKGNTISSDDPSENKTFLVSSDKLTISTDITNKSGSELPSTGGIGTTIFYVVGSILVVGAAVILITRKRMKSAR